MIAAVERLSTAHVIAKLLALVPSEEGSLNKAIEIGAPSFLTGDAAWGWAKQTFPGLSWMDICKSVFAPGQTDIGSAHPVVGLAAAMFPGQAKLIGPVVDLIQEDPDLIRIEVEKWVQNPAVLQKGVNTLLKAPEELIRCRDCHQPFYTDGSRGCPFCSEH